MPLQWMPIKHYSIAKYALTSNIFMESPDVRATPTGFGAAPGLVYTVKRARGAGTRRALRGERENPKSHAGAVTETNGLTPGANKGPTRAGRVPRDGIRSAPMTVVKWASGTRGLSDERAFGGTAGVCLGLMIKRPSSRAA